MLAATLGAIVQGGMLTEIVRARFISGQAQASYFDTTPSFRLAAGRGICAFGIIEHF